MQDTAKLVNNSPGSTIRLPTTIYKIKKEIETATKLKYERYFHCSKFKIYTNDNKCRACSVRFKPSETSFFIYIPLKQQLKLVLNKYWTEDNNASNFIRDTQDGKIYQNIKNKYKDLIILSLQLNTDGTTVGSSNRNSLWPVHFYLNFLPPRIRFVCSNMVVVALYYGSQKPDMQSLFLPLVQELDSMKRGFQIERNNDIFTFLPLITHCSLDLPAKAAVQGIKQFNGTFSCGYCLHKGVSVQNINSKNKKSSTIRYLHQAIVHRTHEEAKKDMIKAQKNNIISNGFKEISSMALFSHFDLIDSFCIDYLHGCLLGLMRDLLKHWMLPKNHLEDFYLTAELRQVVDKRLEIIKPRSSISRRPHAISAHIADLDASDLRSLILYYLPVCMQNLSSNHKKYHKHFMLLAASIYILLQKEISPSELAEAENMLKNFVIEFEILYGKHRVTMNLHNLIHICDAVRNLGPLWSQSMFAFETNNGVLSNIGNISRGILCNIAQRYISAFSLKFSQGSTNKTSETAFSGKKKKYQLTNVEKQILNEKNICFEGNSLHVWYRCTINNLQFTSTEYRQTQRIDFFMQFSDHSYGTAKFYFEYNVDCFRAV